MHANIYIYIYIYNYSQILEKNTNYSNHYGIHPPNLIPCPRRGCWPMTFAPGLGQRPWPTGDVHVHPFQGGGGGLRVAGEGVES